MGDVNSKVGQIALRVLSDLFITMGEVSSYMVGFLRGKLEGLEQEDGTLSQFVVIEIEEPIADTDTDKLDLIKSLSVVVPVFYRRLHDGNVENETDKAMIETLMAKIAALEEVEKTNKELQEVCDSKDLELKEANKGLLEFETYRKETEELLESLRSDINNNEIGRAHV